MDGADDAEERGPPVPPQGHLHRQADASTPLYSFAYDQKEELWKIIWHNKRWSEDTSLTGEWYPGWPGVAEAARRSRVVTDTIVNVQTGTGNRIEFWDARRARRSTSKGKIRRYIDVGRLTKGR